jgi:hypothetical protein
MKQARPPDNTPEDVERTFTNKFRVIIMPVHGLIDHCQPEKVFENPMSTDRRARAG